MAQSPARPESCPDLILRACFELFKLVTVVEEHGQDTNRAQVQQTIRREMKIFTRKGCCVSSVIALTASAESIPRQTMLPPTTATATVVRIHAPHASARVERGRRRFCRKPRKARTAGFAGPPPGPPL
ncbi:hypothetical protein BV898_05954 [Hypsibius exemplaris]|uniref:Uncharacterized protein n=1 Tax=Hypsibius exemplaris TaxID=2072580 RepID=A0A1W0WXM3_HYPEX|nr:hypothetical protein BV898_05954 [Hypsibius exemplaris]